MRYYFTSDFHLGHGNIVRYANRTIFMNKQEKELHKKGVAFQVSRESQDKMNNGLIRNWNERVKDDDLVFFLGDFCFRSGSGRSEGETNKADYWRIKLNGSVIFIKGNHDNNNSLKTPIEGILITIAKKQIWLVHKPEHYNPKYKINFVGHVHDKWLIKQEKESLLVNVGVDMWNYKPVRWEDIVGGLIKRTKINLYKL